LRWSDKASTRREHSVALRASAAAFLVDPMAIVL
jgi:hypothetical protein